MAEWIVPAGCERAIDRLLTLDRADRAWSLVDWAARRSWIDARYRDRRGSLAIVRLYPRDRSVPVEHRRTERFTLALVQGRGGELLDVLREHVAEHEHAFEWQRLEPPRASDSSSPPAITDPRELDCERTAFELGLKPAVRQLIHPHDAPWAAAMYVRGGAAVCGVTGGLPHGNAVLMAAHTPADARAMLDAEFVQFERDSNRVIAGTRELGRRLGYPSCCVEAFVRSIEVDSPEPGIDDNWRRLDDAWVARPNPRINSMLFGELMQLISFDPCQFDCPAAGAIADALFERLATMAPVAAEALDRQLARPVVVDWRDRRAWVKLEARPDGQTCIRAIEPIRLAWEAREDAPLAVVIGQRVDEFGRLPELPGSRHRVFRFDRYQRLR
jgi:hypothetical protein